MLVVANQVAKGHQKSKQTSKFKKFCLNFRKCRDDLLVKKYMDKGRDGAYSRTSSYPTFHKSHPHKYPYMWCFEID